jgi:hypothetical protein
LAKSRQGHQVFSDFDLSSKMIPQARLCPFSNMSENDTLAMVLYGVKMFSSSWLLSKQHARRKRIPLTWQERKHRFWAI